MIKHNQDGGVSGVGVSLVLTILLLIGAIAFGGWAYLSRTDYKNNTYAKIADAVTIAKQKEGTAKDAQFLQDEKKPLRTFQGPEAYGSIKIDYPKTWSGYVDTKGNGSVFVDGYFAPNIVPAIGDANSIFSLRVQVLQQPYDQALTLIKSTATNSSVVVPPVITPYVLPKVPGTVGIKISGTLVNGKQGTMIALPLRAQTIEIWAETSQFTPDFENLILPNISFVP